jgi:F-type H+-transporting ATPase subunit b
LELNWSTFLLEIINFLVLLWILKHFLYKPVLDVIARRRAGIDAQLAQARDLRDEAERLKAEYEGRLTEWQREQARARAALGEEIDQERAKRLAALQATLEQERQKAAVAEARRREDERRAMEGRALEQGARFATRLLSLAAGTELESRLIDLAVEDLRTLSAERVSALRTQWGSTPAKIRVASALPLPEDRRPELEQVLREVSGLDTPVAYEIDTRLVAGLRISIGAWVLAANLEDELKGFAGFAHDA